eukprot:2447324-Amphidinium_carterae.1
MMAFGSDRTSHESNLATAMKLCTAMHVYSQSTLMPSYNMAIKVNLHDWLANGMRQPTQRSAESWLEPNCTEPAANGVTQALHKRKFQASGLGSTLANDTRPNYLGWRHQREPRPNKVTYNAL